MEYRSWDRLYLGIWQLDNFFKLHIEFVVVSVSTAGLYLVVEFLQQAVQPGLSHLHGPGLVGYVAHFDQNHHQLNTNHDEKTRHPIYIS